MLLSLTMDEFVGYDLSLVGYIQTECSCTIHKDTMGAYVGIFFFIQWWSTSPIWTVYRGRNRFYSIGDTSLVGTCILSRKLLHSSSRNLVERTKRSCEDVSFDLFATKKASGAGDPDLEGENKNNVSCSLVMMPAGNRLYL